MLLTFEASNPVRYKAAYCTYLLLAFPPAPANNSDESSGKNVVSASDNTFIVAILETTFTYAYVLYGESFVEISVRTCPSDFAFSIKDFASLVYSKKNLAFEVPWFLNVPSEFISGDELINVWNFPLSR